MSLESGMLTDHFICGDSQPGHGILKLSKGRRIKDKTPRDKQNTVVYAVLCIPECTDLYMGEVKQPLHKHMAQHMKAQFTGQEQGTLSFEDSNGNIKAREDRWFERGVKIICQTGAAIFKQRRGAKTPTIRHLQRSPVTHIHLSSKRLHQFKRLVGSAGF